MATPARNPILSDRPEPNVTSLVPSRRQSADASGSDRSNGFSAAGLHGKPIKNFVAARRVAGEAERSASPERRPTPPYVAPRAPLTESPSSRRTEQWNSEERCSTPAYVAPRAPLSESPSPTRTEQWNSDAGTAGGAAVQEDAMAGAPELGAGRVMHLARAFEKLLVGEGTERKNRAGVMKEEAGGVGRPAVASALETAFPGDDSGDDCASRRTSVGVHGDRESCGFGRMSSSEMSGSRKKVVTRPQPFDLKTEQRGKVKEEIFANKVREMALEAQRQRIPLAQDMPWSTYVPQKPVKPPRKELTEPIDVVLRSDARAAERAVFDRQDAVRIRFNDEFKLNKERERKLLEEEEVKKLRKELVPKAQPLPDFRRPFVPKRSTKPPTVPKEPRFHSRLSSHDSKS